MWRELSACEMSVGDYPIKIGRVICPPGQLSTRETSKEEMYTPGQFSYITHTEKSLPNFRQRKFEQTTSDSLSLIVN